MRAGLTVVWLALLLATNHVVADENDQFDWLLPDAQEARAKPAVDPLEFARIKLTPNDFEPIFAQNKDAALIEAARRNDLGKVQGLLKAGANANAQGDLGWRPLIHAARIGNVEMVRALLDSHADPDASGGGYRPLGAAIVGGHTRIAKLLLRAGASVDLKGGDGNTPLIEAALTNRADAVRILLKHGANPSLFNSMKWNAMSAAAIADNREAMEALLGAGVDPNLLDGEGNSPLYWATNHQHRDIMWLLAEHGGKVLFNVP